MKLLFITGCDRSGSTALASVLGSIDGFLNVGELHHIWMRGIVENWWCGCRTPLRDCPFWDGVLETAFGGVAQVPARKMDAERIAAYRSLRSSPDLQLDALAYPSYLANLAALCEGIEHQASPRVVVDSSKSASHGWFLRNLDQVDLYVIHLVRDPRAVASSWAAAKPIPGAGDQAPALMTRLSAEEAARWWIRINQRSEVLCRALPDRCRFLLYEQFTANPRGVTEEILTMIGEAPAPDLFTGSHQVRARLSHTVCGNPCRFDHRGELHISRDQRWRTEMSDDNLQLVSELTKQIWLRYQNRPAVQSTSA